MAEPTAAEEIQADYVHRRRAYATRITDLRKTFRRLSHGRGLTFLAGLACFCMAYQQPAISTLWISLGVVGMVIFVGLAIYQDTIQRRLERTRLLDQTVRAQLARLARDWKHVPQANVEVPRAHREVARDLDLFGRASLFQWVNQACTPQGRATLRDWLLEPATADEIVLRQGAARELAACQVIREELILRGRMLASSLTGPDAFVRWAEEASFLRRRGWLLQLARSTPFVFCIAICGLGLDWLPLMTALTLIVSMLLVNLLASVVYTGQIHDIFNRISTRSGELQHYRTLFELVAALPTGAARLQTIRHCAVEENRGAVHQLARLRHIMWLAGLRHAGLLSILYVVLQLTVLWDVHVVWLLERWQQRNGGFVRGWFDALGELEAISSIACVAHDNPSWSFPEFLREGPPSIVARQVGHPLLTNESRVCNDVRLGPPGSVLLVTGSNMSGKSTLLRAIGINVILAEAGAPVCAASMKLTSMTVTTSMRIQDSLENGISFFMAELQRLKAIVDQATHYSKRSDRTLLFLLDEILQGTNSVERHMAVVRVLTHLMEARAMGAVSTHDLDLASCAELAECCQIVHFRETLHDSPQEGLIMDFDYKLRDGLATTTNALKLLKLVGLD